MVTMATAKTPIVYVNEAFTQLTGYTCEEVIGKSPSLLQGAGTDPAVLDQLRKDLGAGRNFEGRTTNYRKDGTPFTMHWRVAPVRSGKDEVHYFIAVGATPRLTSESQSSNRAVRSPTIKVFALNMQPIEKYADNVNENDRQHVIIASAKLLRKLGEDAS